MALGNPAPLGLLGFGMTTAMLMYVEMGWVEAEFEQLIFGYSIFLGGSCQMIVSIFELLKGSSFSFAVFGCYGAFWLGWGIVYAESHRTTSSFDLSAYPDGKTAWFVQWGLLTGCFFAIAIRKNNCLMATLGLLTATFFVLACASGTGNANVKKTAGYVGFATAIAAGYQAFAELVNEEYGKPVLPGLAPHVQPASFNITKESFAALTSYDDRTNTLFLTFRGMQIKTDSDIVAISEGIEDAIKDTNAPGGKVNVVSDYKDVLLAEDKVDAYWAMVERHERQYYLSASRFHVSSSIGGASLEKK
jgi:succinate-acetate transporter protein